MSDDEHEEAGAGEDASGWSTVSELHLTLQEVLLELHRATVRAARPGKRPAEAQAKEGEEDEAPARALLAAGRRFERLVEALPDAVRCPRDVGLEKELRDLQRQDVEASEQAEQLSARAEALRASVDARWREACEELCGGTVTVATAEESPASTDQPQAAAAATGGAAAAPGRQGAEPSSVGGRGVRPRLQDLTQEKSRRFIEELEFLQCLANPEYVQWLATHHYLEDPAFVEFLEYLSYWRHPPHVYHVVYPQALRMLEMLRNPAIRCRVHRMDTRALLQGQMMWKWSHAQEVALEPATSSSALAAPVGAAAAAAAATAAAPRTAPVGDGVLREWDVLQDWTGLTGVIADKAWHEKMERINAPVYTVEHDAKQIGMIYLDKNMKDRKELERAVEKYQHFWEDEGGAGDLGKVLVAQHTERLSKGWEVPKDVLNRLAPAPAAASGEAPARKRGKRS